MKTRQDILADYTNEVNAIKEAYLDLQITPKEKTMSLKMAKEKRNTLLSELPVIPYQDKPYRGFQLIVINPDGRSWEGVYGESYKDIKILMEILAHDNPEKRYFIQKINKPPFKPCGNLKPHELDLMLSALRTLTNFSSQRFPAAKSRKYVNV